MTLLQERFIMASHEVDKAISDKANSQGSKNYDKQRELDSIMEEDGITLEQRNKEVQNELKRS